jgi:hypothetical protein
MSGFDRLSPIYGALFSCSVEGPRSSQSMFDLTPAPAQRGRRTQLLKFRGTLLTARQMRS